MSLPRRELLLRCRPQIDSISESTLPIEQFQNRTLRPILKFQNDILVRHYLNFLENFKQDFTLIPEAKILAKITTDLQKNSGLKHLMIGCIVGFLDDEETSIYLINSKELNKRIMSMLIERLYDQLLKKREIEPSIYE